MLRLKKDTLTGIVAMRLLKIILIITLLLTLSTATFAATNTEKKQQPFSQRPDVQKFIKTMVDNYNFKQKNLEQIFDGVKVQQSILKAMSKPAESWPWHKYQKFFITTTRIKGGVDFWNKHAKTLAAVEKKEGVPASIIVSIIGVETLYGQNQGNYRVLDSLATLAFIYPKRKPFFQSELKAYLLLARENQFDVASMLGSYAGAIGQGQFMPSSYRAYAVNYKKTGATDLRNDTDAVIASIGNYLKKHGWRSDAPIATRASITGNKYKKLKANQLKPKYSIEFLKKHHVVPKTEVSDKTKSNFMILQGKNSPEYWLGFNDFYVISRYNPRINYAMAVYQLSEAISKARTLNNK